MTDVRARGSFERGGRLLHVVGQAVVLADHAEDDGRQGPAAADLLGLTEDGGGLGERADLQHAGLAGDEGEVGAEEQRPADLGVAARSVGDDEVSLLVQAGQAVEDRVGAVELEGADVRSGLAHPLGGGMLRVAIGEDHAVSLLVEPGRQVDREGGFAHASLAVCNNDDHTGIHT